MLCGEGNSEKDFVVVETEYLKSSKRVTNQNRAKLVHIKKA